MNQEERLAAIRELYPTHDALKRRVRELEARLRAIATAKPMEGEPLWHFFDRVQAIASQSDAGSVK